jgi:carbonic anhydrase
MTGKLDRRQALKLAGMGLAVGVLPAIADAQEFRMPDTPQEAITKLVDGNARFAANQLRSITEDLNILKSHTVDEQKPFVAILGCADSRVPVELVFDQTIGRLFVVRVAGNVVTPETIASLEYGAAVLGIKAVVVLGHRNCGAVKATIAAKAVPGQISSLYQYIQPALTTGNKDAEAGSRANAAYQARLLTKSSPLLQGMVHESKLVVKPAYYDVETGRVEWL